MFLYSIVLFCFLITVIVFVCFFITGSLIVFNNFEDLFFVVVFLFFCLLICYSGIIKGIENHATSLVCQSTAGHAM